MQIVINLSEKDYKSLNRYINFNLEYEDGRILSAVKQGVVLPENHGRLIEITPQLEQELFTFTRWTGIDEAPYESATMITDDAPTILEATEGEK